jgi:glutamate synthase domain-containing protein 2
MRKILAVLAALGALAGIAVVARRDRASGVPIRKHFPILYWGRWLGYELGPLLRQYIVAGDEDERPFTRTQRLWVKRSAEGSESVLGFGSQYDIDSPGAVSFTPKTFTNPVDDLEAAVGSGVRRIIGGRGGVTPVAMPNPLYISAMSFGSLSARAIEALNQGAAAANIWHNSGEGGLSPYHLAGGAGVIAQMGTAKFGVRNPDGSLNDELLAELGANENVKMIEIKLSQGAKPGKGGILPGSKVTPQIAEIRKMKVGETVMSPARHAEFDDVAGLFDFIDHVRSVSKVPVGIKTAIGNPSEIDAIAKAMGDSPERGPDFITIDGGEGGSGAAPEVLMAHAGLPLRQALVVANDALTRWGVREDVTVLASGKLIEPSTAALALALGADVVGSARGFMMALGCIQSLRCQTGTCPTGIATQDPDLQKCLDVDAAAERVARYADALLSEIVLLARSCGHDDPSQLTPEDALVMIDVGHWVPARQAVTVELERS